MRVEGLRREKTFRGTGCMHGHRGSQSNLMWVCPCSILLHQQPAVAAQALMNIKFYQGEMFSDEIYIKTSLDPTLECKTCPFIVNSPWIHKLNLWWCCFFSTKGRSIIATLCNDDCCLKWKYTKWNILLNSDIGLYLIIIYSTLLRWQKTHYFSHTVDFFSKQLHLWVTVPRYRWQAYIYHHWTDYDSGNVQTCVCYWGCGVPQMCVLKQCCYSKRCLSVK